MDRLLTLAAWPETAKTAARVASLLTTASMLLLSLPRPAAAHHVPIHLAFSELKCFYETNDDIISFSPSDEPYVLMFVADLSDPQQVVAEVKRTTVFDDVDQDEIHRQWVSLWYPSGGVARPIGSPEDVLILVAVMEHDDGYPSVVFDSLQARLGSNLQQYRMSGLHSAIVRERVKQEMQNLIDAWKGQEPPGYYPRFILNGDDRIGAVQELRLTTSSIQNAANGVLQTFWCDFSGQGGYYRLRFEMNRGAATPPPTYGGGGGGSPSPPIRQN